MWLIIWLSVGVGVLIIIILILVIIVVVVCRRSRNRSTRRRRTSHNIAELDLEYKPYSTAVISPVVRYSSDYDTIGDEDHNYLQLRYSTGE